MAGTVLRLANTDRMYVEGSRCVRWCRLLSLQNNRRNYLNRRPALLVLVALKMMAV